jgi:hypothetical protein
MKRRYVLIGMAAIATLAIATPGFGLSKDLKKAIAKEVSKQIASATGPQGPSGSAGQPGQAGATGAPGAPGAPGQDGADGTGGVLAYAFGSGGAAGITDTVDETRSLNVADANVTHPADGIWCFDLPFTVRNAVASAVNANHWANIQGLNGDGTACPGDESFLVNVSTMALSGTVAFTASNSAFTVLIN